MHEPGCPGEAPPHGLRQRGDQGRRITTFAGLSKDERVDNSCKGIRAERIDKQDQEHPERLGEKLSNTLMTSRRTLCESSCLRRLAFKITGVELFNRHLPAGAAAPHRGRSQRHRLLASLLTSFQVLDLKTQVPPLCSIDVTTRRRRRRRPTAACLSAVMRLGVPGVNVSCSYQHVAILTCCCRPHKRMKT